MLSQREIRLRALLSSCWPNALDLFRTWLPLAPRDTSPFPHKLCFVRFYTPVRPARAGIKSILRHKNQLEGSHCTKWHDSNLSSIAENLRFRHSRLFSHSQNRVIRSSEQRSCNGAIRDVHVLTSNREKFLKHTRRQHCRTERRGCMRHWSVGSDNGL
jgi:hypothetical protein